MDERLKQLHTDEADYWAAFLTAKEEIEAAEKWMRKCYRRWYLADQALHSYQIEHDRQTNKKTTRTNKRTEEVLS